MTVLEPVRSAVRPFVDLAPPEDRAGLGDCAGLADGFDLPEGACAVLLLLAGWRLSAPRPDRERWEGWEPRARESPGRMLK